MESEVGDWHALSGRFGSLPDMVGQVRDAGRRESASADAVRLTPASQISG